MWYRSLYRASAPKLSSPLSIFVIKASVNQEMSPWRTSWKWLKWSDLRGIEGSDKTLQGELKKESPFKFPISKVNPVEKKVLIISSWSILKYMCLKKMLALFLTRMQKKKYEKITEVIWEEEKARDRSVPDGSDKHRRSQHWQSTSVINICGRHR